MRVHNMKWGFSKEVNDNKDKKKGQIEDYIGYI